MNSIDDLSKQLQERLLKIRQNIFLSTHLDSESLQDLEINLISIIKSLHQISELIAPDFSELKTRVIQCICLGQNNLRSLWAIQAEKDDSDKSLPDTVIMTSDSDEYFDWKLRFKDIGQYNIFD